MNNAKTNSSTEGSRTRTAAMALAKWAVPAPDMGPAVYCLTRGPREHKHTYHLFNPWSPDGEYLLLARYDRIEPSADICMMQCASGEINVIGRSRKWESHAMAFQQWQGNTGRVFYLDADKTGPIGVTCAPDGGDVRTIRLDNMTSVFCGPEGRYLYGATTHAAMFPNDAIAPRHDKGVLRLDLETGERRVILSIADALKIPPEGAAPEHCHLHAKMVIVHRHLPRLLFNLTNTFWDQGLHEPRVRLLLTVGTDGADPRYVGPCVHHPNWHPVENRIVTNLRDATGTMRLGLYDGDGRELLEYVPRTKGSGHPSFSPDGRWLCTDGAGPGGEQIIICDPLTGEARAAATGKGCSEGYATQRAIAERAPGETVIAALVRALSGELRAWITQAHPAWSHDGSAILFNRDVGEGSQVYMIDIRQALSAPRQTSSRSS